MVLLPEKTEDVGKEKHVPIIERKDNQIIVRVGEIPHPMESNHYIQWIELIENNKCYRKELKPGDEPKAVFRIESNSFSVRAYCNIHGLWKNLF